MTVVDFAWRSIRTLCRNCAAVYRFRPFQLIYAERFRISSRVARYILDSLARRVDPVWIPSWSGLARSQSATRLAMGPFGIVLATRHHRPKIRDR